MWIAIAIVALPIGAALLVKLLHTIRLAPDQNEDFIFF